MKSYLSTRTLTRNYRRALFVLSILVLIIFWIRDNTRRSVKYLIPQGYIGWVQIKYREAKFPPLPIQDGYYVVKFSSGGTFSTSSSAEDGWGKQEFYYVSKEGQLRDITLDLIAFQTADTSGKNDLIFIGTQDQFRQYQKLRGGIQAPGAVDPARLKD